MKRCEIPVAATDGVQAAVALEQLIDAVDHLRLVGARAQAQGDVVEGAVHVEGRAHRVAAHPQHAETAVVGEDVGAADLVDVLRRQGDADHAQGLPAAVHDGAEGVADVEVVGGGEGLAGDHLVAPAWLDPAAAPQVQVVEDRHPPFGDRLQAAGGRLGQAGHVEGDVEDDARLHRGDAGDARQPRRQRVRSALEVHEDVGEAVVGVVRRLRDQQRRVGRAGADENRHAAGDDQGDGDHLAAQVPEVAAQLAVEGAHHQVSSSGRARRSFTCTSTMRPLRRRTTRWPIAAMAALWVMTAVVVPTSRLTRSMTSSTSLPVS